MKSKLAAIVLAATVLLTGCWQKSLHPFYKDSDLTYDEKLVGTWREIEEDKDSEDKGMLWTIEKGQRANSYRIKIEDGEIKLDYEGRLFKLGNDRLLDLYSRGRNIAEIAAHNLFRINELNETMTIQTLDLGWFSKYLKDHPNEIEHITLSDPDNPDNTDEREVVLTAKTDDVQKFLTKHMNAEKFWSEPGKLKRVSK